MLARLQPILPGLTDAALAARHRSDAVAPRRRRVMSAVVGVYGADVGVAPSLHDLGSAVLDATASTTHHPTLRRYEEVQSSTGEEPYPLTLAMAIGFITAGILERGLLSTGARDRLQTLEAEARAEGKAVTTWDTAAAARAISHLEVTYPARAMQQASPLTASDYTLIHNHLATSTLSDDDLGYLCLLGLWIATGCRGGELPDLMWADVRMNDISRTVSVDVVLSKTNKKTLVKAARVGYDETAGGVIIADLAAGRARLGNNPAAGGRVAVRAQPAPSRWIGLPWTADGIVKRTRDLLAELSALDGRTIGRKSSRVGAHDRNLAAGLDPVTAKALQGWKSDESAAKYTALSRGQLLEAAIAAHLAASGGGGSAAGGGKR